MYWLPKKQYGFLIDAVTNTVLLFVTQLQPKMAGTAIKIKTQVRSMAENFTDQVNQSKSKSGLNEQTL